MKRLLCIIALAALVGCATTETPQQKVFAATQVYDTALSVAVTYKRLPLCSPTTGPVCSDKSVVATLQKADVVAYEALKSAQGVVRAPAVSESAAQMAVRWATEAVAAFSRVTSLLNVK